MAGYRDQTPDQTLTFANTTNAYLMTGLTKGRSYFVRVLATNDAGLNNVSDAVNKPALDTPNAPTIASAVADSLFTINLAWALSLDTGLGPAIRPQWPMRQQCIQLATDAAFTNNVYSIMMTPNATTQAITGLNKGWHYYIRIFSSNMLGESVASNSKTEHAIDSPSLPLNLQVVVSTTSTRELLLSWDYRRHGAWWCSMPRRVPTRTHSSPNTAGGHQHSH